MVRSLIDVPDISLYDPSRTAAGIAACLSDYHHPDTWNDHAIRDPTAEKFRLLARLTPQEQECLSFRLERDLTGYNVSSASISAPRSPNTRPRRLHAFGTSTKRTPFIL